LKIKTLAFHHLQTDHKNLFKPRRIIKRTISYKIRCPRALYDIFWPTYINFTESLREFSQIVPPTPPQQTTVKHKCASDQSVHTFGILEAPILYSNGCFISSSSGTVSGGKGLTKHNHIHSEIHIQRLSDKKKLLLTTENR
jgi:hypothetical protein